MYRSNSNTYNSGSGNSGYDGGYDGGKNNGIKNHIKNMEKVISSFVGAVINCTEIFRIINKE